MRDIIMALCLLGAFIFCYAVIEESINDIFKND